MKITLKFALEPIGPISYASFNQCFTYKEPITGRRLFVKEGPDLKKRFPGITGKKLQEKKWKYEKKMENEGSVVGHMKNHQNILSPIGIATGPKKKKMLVYPLINGKDLYGTARDIADRTKASSLPCTHIFSYQTQILPFLLQAAKGLAHTHKENVCHYDIKPENFLVDHEAGNIVFLTDFGFSEKSTQDGHAPHPWGYTTLYMPPEIFQDDGMNTEGLINGKSVDVWSFGILMYTILRQGCDSNDGFSDYPFEEDENGLPIFLPTNFQISKTIRRGLKDNISPKIIQFLCSIIRIKPEDRPTMDMIVAEIDNFIDEPLQFNNDAKQSNNTQLAERTTDMDSEIDTLKEVVLDSVEKIRALGKALQSGSYGGIQQRGIEETIGTLTDNMAPFVCPDHLPSYRLPHISSIITATTAAITQENVDACAVLARLAEKARMMHTYQQILIEEEMEREEDLCVGMAVGPSVTSAYVACEGIHNIAAYQLDSENILSESICELMAEACSDMHSLLQDVLRADITTTVKFDLCRKWAKKLDNDLHQVSIMTSIASHDSSMPYLEQSDTSTTLNNKIVILDSNNEREYINAKRKNKNDMNTNSFQKCFATHMNDTEGFNLKNNEEEDYEYGEWEDGDNEQDGMEDHNPEWDVNVGEEMEVNDNECDDYTRCYKRHEDTLDLYDLEWEPPAPKRLCRVEPISC